VSINAVGFAITARVKINPEVIKYLFAPLSKIFHSFLEFFICHKKINHERIANIVIAKTPRSVLLSTKTKNAHIQLVNQKSKLIHQK
jgi:hypothetical protein